MKRTTLTLLLIVVATVLHAQQPHQPPVEAQVAFDRGVALRTAKDLQGALTALSYAIQVDPNYSEAWRQRGLTYSDLGRAAEAMAEINQAITIDPRNAKAYNSRAFLKYAQKDYAGAVADTTLAIKMDPQFSNAHMNRGITSYGLETPLAGWQMSNEPCKSIRAMRRQCITSA